MHFLKKTIGFMAVLCVVPAAFAATARPSVLGNAGSRIPTMTTKLVTTTSTSASTTSSALLANAECIDAYSECIHGADACGENFEECTTKVLFHGKMPQCLGTLAQCAASGVSSLFGTATISALSNIATKNTYGEVTDYTYPTDGSVLGQMITAAAISNQYDTSTCVRRYTSCLKKDAVCGEDFELCTTNKEFRKQRVLCDSTLARCQSDGVIELLGSSNRTAAPTASSRIGEAIAEGAALAAVNAVATCYKVIDQCILGACAENPYKCYENSNQSVVSIVEAINAGTEIPTEELDGIVNRSAISGYIKNSCLDTIGSNKYCYATFLGNGQMPTNAQLRDEDNQEEIFDEAYSARMNDSMKSKIADLINKFDTRAKQKCTDTVRSCAMRVCGGGIGSACYAAVFGAGGDNSINGSNTYEEIKTGCSAIVNTDTYCKYAAKNPNSAGTYTYTYINRDAFDILFPEYDSGTEVDPIGVVASLNSSLATSYSDAALAQLKKQCQSLASSCVKTMCGADYMNCYRNRTDMYSSLTQTNDDAFNKSMNKVGGVLDYTIVLGLCLDTVKNAASCEEHLAIEANKIKAGKLSSADSVWKDANGNAKSSVRDGWIDAGAATKLTVETEKVALTDAYGNPLCRTESGEECVCHTVADEISGEVCDIPQMIDYTTYVQNQAATSLFKDLIYDIEKEAQAKYNAKITKEQNMCYAANQGGIMGTKDNGSTFMWAKLKGNRVPKDYTVNGFKPTAFTASNELYGSFCRVRVTLQSDDKKIQDYMKGKNWTTAYFAVGDSFTCGSWIPENDLQDMAENAAKGDKFISEKDADIRRRTEFWTTALGALGGSIGGIALGESIRTGETLGGLTGWTANDKKDQKTVKGHAQDCVEYIEAADRCNINSDNCQSVKTKNLRLAASSAKNAGVNSVYYNNTRVYCTKTQADGSGSYVCRNEDGFKYDTANSGGVSAEQINQLKAQCKQIVDKNPEMESTEKKDAKHGWVTAVSTIALGTAGALLVNKATRDIQDSELDAQQKAAYTEWMNNVGRHINCFVGGDEAGSYGDVLAISVD